GEECRDLGGEPRGRPRSRGPGRAGGHTTGCGAWRGAGYRSRAASARGGGCWSWCCCWGLSAGWDRGGGGEVGRVLSAGGGPVLGCLGAACAECGELGGGGAFLFGPGDDAGLDGAVRAASCVVGYEVGALLVVRTPSPAFCLATAHRVAPSLPGSGRCFRVRVCPCARAGQHHQGGLGGSGWSGSREGPRPGERGAVP